jgi:DNA-binding YbaB/EbfC family protein
MDFNKLMRQAQQMQEEMQKKQKEIEETLFTGEAGGAVKVSMYGNYKVEKVDILQDAIDPSDKEGLEDMVKLAFQNVLDQIKKAQEDLANSMRSSLGGGF